jgi:hypothetical protein
VSGSPLPLCAYDSRRCAVRFSRRVPGPVAGCHRPILSCGSASFRVLRSGRLAPRTLPPAVPPLLGFPPLQRHREEPVLSLEVPPSSTPPRSRFRTVLARFFPARPLRACFIPQALLGFSLQGFPPTGVPLARRHTGASPGSGFVRAAASVSGRPRPIPFLLQIAPPWGLSSRRRWRASRDAVRLSCAWRARAPEGPRVGCAPEVASPAEVASSLEAAIPLRGFPPPWRHCCRPASAVARRFVPPDEDDTIRARCSTQIRRAVSTGVGYAKRESRRARITTQKFFHTVIHRVCERRADVAWRA